VRRAKSGSRTINFHTAAPARRRQRTYDAPLTSIVVPVAYVASGEARNAMTPPTSAGVPIRPEGISAAIAAPSVSSASADISVAMKPGATANAVIPSRAHERAIDFVRLISAALLAP